VDVLPDDQKLTIETARVIREGFLQQNAFHKTDTYMTAKNQMTMIEVILHLYDEAKALVDKNVPLGQLMATGVYADLSRMKFGLGEGKTKEEYMALVDSAVAKVREANA
jgi:Archaeal/vacuolar-type H+-ATPase subunit A